MEKGLLVCYYDNTESTEDVICVNKGEKLTEGAKNSVRHWLDDFDEDDVESAIAEIDNDKTAYIGDFELYTKEVWIYSN